MTIKEVELMPEDEYARMQDTRQKLNEMLGMCSELSVGLSLVWLWTWSTIKDYYDDEDLIVKDEETVFAALWQAVADGHGFSLEYGAEQHSDDVRDWMFDKELMVLAEDEEEAEDE
jgi:hypothetical protein